MCGRVGFYDDKEWKSAVVRNIGNVRDEIGTLVPHYNIAPSQPLATLLGNGTYRYTGFGFIPHWMKEPKAVAINARAESIAWKPSFKSSFRHRRCLIPVNGFFEWKREGARKIPFWVHPSTSTFFALAGIWDEWHGSLREETVITSAIITTEPNELMRPIHDRMPVILEEKDWGMWLDSAVAEPEALQPLLRPYDPAKMQAYTVSSYVNSPTHDDIKAIVPVKESLF